MNRHNRQSKPQRHLRRILSDQHLDGQAKILNATDQAVIAYREIRHCQTCGACSAGEAAEAMEAVIALLMDAGEWGREWQYTIDQYIAMLGQAPVSAAPGGQLTLWQEAA